MHTFTYDTAKSFSIYVAVGISVNSDNPKECPCSKEFGMDARRIVGLSNRTINSFWAIPTVIFAGLTGWGRRGSGFVFWAANLGISPTKGGRPHHKNMYTHRGVRKVVVVKGIPTKGYMHSFAFTFINSEFISSVHAINLDRSGYQVIQ